MLGAGAGIAGMGLEACGSFLSPSRFLWARAEAGRGSRGEAPVDDFVPQPLDRTPAPRLQAGHIGHGRGKHAPWQPLPKPESLM